MSAPSSDTPTPREMIEAECMESLDCVPGMPCAAGTGCAMQMEAAERVIAAMTARADGMEKARSAPRDCPHGHQMGKCDLCDLQQCQRELDAMTAAREEIERLTKQLDAGLTPEQMDTAWAGAKERYNKDFAAVQRRRELLEMVGHVSVGFIHAHVGWQWHIAVFEAQRAIAAVDAALKGGNP
jgi:hypothetical protein